MATILEFRRPERQQCRDRKAAPQDHSAEIVIFPGVRIERQKAAASDVAPASSAGGTGTGSVRRD